MAFSKKKAKIEGAHAYQAISDDDTDVKEFKEWITRESGPEIFSQVEIGFGPCG